MKLIDTNIIIRLIIKDDKKQAKKTYDFFEKVIKGKEKYLLTHLSIAEIVWVLDSFYKIERKNICECILKIINTDNIEIIEQDIVMNSFLIWEKIRFSIDYIDAYNVGYAEYYGCSSIISYDKDFDKLDIIKREEP